MVASLRRQLPDLPEDLATPIAAAADPRDDAEAQQRGQAAATLVADALQDVLDEDLLLVLDDCHEIDGATGSWRFVEALVRFAPPALHVLLVSDAGEAELLCGRAAEVWTAASIPYGYARNRLILASILDGDRARAAAEDAAGVFRSLGARGPATEAAERLETLDRAGRPALEIGALGRFRVLRGGEPVPPTAWQSKKARDLLKVLVARRGRPTTRETLFDILWPDEDPEPLANRLSVALATMRAVLDPEKRFASDWFVGGDKQAVWLDLSHVDVDVEAFLAVRGLGGRPA